MPIQNQSWPPLPINVSRIVQSLQKYVVEAPADTGLQPVAQASPAGHPTAEPNSWGSISHDLSLLLPGGSLTTLA